MDIIGELHQLNF